ncbi:MAG: hypothetical protein Q8L01_01695, partial [Candidatus Woesebacteria bacterium]|nr:hypothetical protein [Candidatus Woesebacteria bacterium]
TGLSSANAQTLQKDGDHYELTLVSPNPGTAHNSANTFAQQVGDVLKSTYPSKVLDPTVSLRVFMRGDQKFYRLTWSCRIVKASVADADYYFDRRGTLLSGSTLTDAKRKVETEIERSGKVSIMRKAFTSAKFPENFIRDSFSGSSAEGYWYIKEFFLVVPK